MLLATSCVELDQLPQSFLTEEEYIETPQTLDVVAKAVSGVYKDMWNGNYGFSCRILRYSTAAGDIVPLVTKPNNDMLYLYNMTPTTSGSVKDVTALWKNFWDVISSSNKIIGGTPIPEDQAEAAKYKAVVAEARFMRALAYFHLVRMFGDVPFIASSGKLSRISCLVFRLRASMMKSSFPISPSLAPIFLRQAVRAMPDLLRSGLPKLVWRT